MKRVISGLTIWLLLRGWLLLAGGLLLAGPGHAQDLGRAQGERYFRVEAERGTTRGGRPILWGYVYNDYGLRAINVRLLAEGLDASGRVLSRTTGFLNGDIAPFSRAYFEMPAPPDAAGHRVTVASVFFTQGGGGGS